MYLMWIMGTLQFGMRTGKETRDPRTRDVVLRLDDNGLEYLVYTQERQRLTPY